MLSEFKNNLFTSDITLIHEMCHHWPMQYIANNTISMWCPAVYDILQYIWLYCDTVLPLTGVVSLPSGTKCKMHLLISSEFVSFHLRGEQKKTLRNKSCSPITHAFGWHLTTLLSLTFSCMSFHSFIRSFSHS